METVMTIFGIIGIIVSILAVILFVAWAVSFYGGVAFKTFKYNIEEYTKIKREHIEKNTQARRIRWAKSREQKNNQKSEMQAIKLQSKQDLFEIKKREQISKEQDKVERAKSQAIERSGLSLSDIGEHNYQNLEVPAEIQDLEKDILDNETYFEDMPQNIEHPNMGKGENESKE